MAGTSDKNISGIVAGCSQEARQALTDLLAVVFNTLDHLDIICPVARPPCHEYLRFQELRRLYSALSQSLRE